MMVTNSNTSETQANTTTETARKNLEIKQNLKGINTSINTFLTFFAEDEDDTTSKFDESAVIEEDNGGLLIRKKI